MIWIVLLILAIFAAYFIYQGIRARQIQRSQHDSRTSAHVPEALAESDARHNQNKAALHSNNGAKSDVAAQPVPAPHDSPSLLYADRNQTATGDNSTQNNQQPSHMASGNTIASDAMDLTAETATLNSDEVGVPANSSEYERKKPVDTVVSDTQHHTSASQGTVAANAADVHTAENTSTAELSATQPTSAEAGQSQHTATHAEATAHHEERGSAAITIGAAAATVAGAAGVAAMASELPQANNTDLSIGDHANDDGIDLELGDSTHNEGNELEDDGDELLDFGDLTADISEMLKELNLRESDSPRLDINEKEYQQLKTGEPGEVKPEKIENVAGKLRNMLQ